VRDELKQRLDLLVSDRRAEASIDADDRKRYAIDNVVLRVESEILVGS
jgi:hypothetical protein